MPVDVDGNANGTPPARGWSWSGLVLVALALPAVLLGTVAAALCMLVAAPLVLVRGGRHRGMLLPPLLRGQPGQG